MARYLKRPYHYIITLLQNNCLANTEVCRWTVVIVYGLSLYSINNIQAIDYLTENSILSIKVRRASLGLI